MMMMGQQSHGDGLGQYSQDSDDSQLGQMQHTGYRQDLQSLQGQHPSVEIEEKSSVVTYRLGTIDMPTHHVQVSVERSILSQNSPTVRLLFGCDGGYEDDGHAAGMIEDDDETVSFGGTCRSPTTATAQPSKTMVDKYLQHSKRQQPVAANDAMVTPPPPLGHRSSGKPGASTGMAAASTAAAAEDKDKDSDIDSQESMSTTKSMRSVASSHLPRYHKRQKKSTADDKLAKLGGSPYCIPTLTPKPTTSTIKKRVCDVAGGMDYGTNSATTGTSTSVSSNDNRTSGFDPCPPPRTPMRATGRGSGAYGRGTGGRSPIPASGNNTSMRGAGRAGFSRSPAVSEAPTLLVGTTGTSTSTPLQTGTASRSRSPVSSEAATLLVSCRSRFGSLPSTATTPTPPRKAAPAGPGGN